MKSFGGRAVWVDRSGRNGEATTREVVSKRSLLMDIAANCPAGQWMNRLKLFGDRIMSRDPDRQTAEIHIRIALMNRFNALGTAEIVRVA